MGVAAFGGNQQSWFRGCLGDRENRLRDGVGFCRSISEAVA
jgi:hypothetical protein